MLLSVVYYPPVVSLVSPGVTKLGKQALWNHRMIYWRCKLSLSEHVDALSYFLRWLFCRMSAVRDLQYTAVVLLPNVGDLRRPTVVAAVQLRLVLSRLQANSSEVLPQIVCPVGTPVPSSECHVISDIFHQERFAQHASADSPTKIDRNTQSQKSQ